MRRFSRLYTELDESNSTNDKLRALESYFAEAGPADAAWALAFLVGNRPRRAVSSTLLRRWVGEVTGHPDWLVEECYSTVGDLAETLALLLPEPGDQGDIALHQLVSETVLALPRLDDDGKRALVTEWWGRLTAPERYLWHKLLLGGFRVGVSRTLVVRALATVCGIDKSEMAHRLMGHWQPTAEDYLRITATVDSPADHTRPYPFYLAHPLEKPPADLGDRADWIAEWKWDGIRAQLIRRRGEVLIWSRGEELVTDRYPEITRAAAALPDGLVLDGELLAWRDGQPLPFQLLQTRIARKTLSKKTLEAAPVAFMAYDVLEVDGIDIRALPQRERRRRLEEIVAPLPAPFVLSPLVGGETWDHLAPLRESSRERLVEGLMLKRATAPYGTGRIKGDWWKWKVEPLCIDVVMVYAQAGHGRRAGLHTDYTFAAWDGERLVPVAKAYSGLTDAEILEVDRWIRKHTLEKHGPVRVVEPQLVFELAFEGIQESSRHKSGIALRFPRIARWRRDKPAAEADTLERVKRFL